MLERAKRASHIDPPASSYAIMRRARPYRGENPEPGKDVLGELDPWPGIREQPGSNCDLAALLRNVRLSFNSGQTPDGLRSRSLTHCGNGFCFRPAAEMR